MLTLGKLLTTYFPALRPSPDSANGLHRKSKFQPVMNPISIKKQMSRRCLLAMVLWLGHCAAFCADTPPPAKQDAKTATKSPAFDTIRYTCVNGKGTGKSLAVTSVGKLEARQRNGPAATVQLPEQELAELAKAVSAVNWQAVHPQYLSEGADLLVTNLSITIKGRVHEIEVNSLAKPPAKLKELFALLDALYSKSIAAPKQ